MSAEKHPQGNVFYRRMKHTHPVITHGEGIYLFDEQGNRYLDGSGGALVVNIGHGVQPVVQAIQEQAAKAAYIHATMFTSKALETYTQELSQVTPLPDARFYPLTTGSEAVEGALKLARQIQLVRGESKRHIVISRWMSYHGVTLGALAVTGKPKMRLPYQPMFTDAPHIPPPFCYRCPYGLEYPACDLRCADALEQEITYHGAEYVSAFIAEPISGATIGGVVPPDGYWARIQEICRKYGVLIIADEVMTGMGRTGKWFGVEHFDIDADILTIGKGAASGYVPLSLLVTKGELVDLISSTAGDFNHGGTFSHHAVGAAAGLATLHYIQEYNLVENAAQKGRYLETALREKFGDHPNIGNIRGIGLMWGLELVADRDTKAPFDYKSHLAQKLADHAFQNGLIIYPGSGSVDGVQGDHFMIGPPLTITEPQIDELIDILTSSLEAVIK